MSSPSSGSGPAAGAARNAAFGLATQLTSALFTAVLTLYLVRALEPSGYGVFSLAVGIGTLLILVSDFGITASAERYMAEHPRDDEAVAAVLSDAVKLKLVIAGLTSAGLFALAAPIAHAYGNDALSWPLRAIAVAVFGQSMMLLYRGAYIALQRVAVTWRMTLAESVVETATSLALVIGGAGAAGAAWGRAIGYVFGAVLALLMTMRFFGLRAVSLRSRPGGRKLEILRYASALLIVGAIAVLMEQIDVLLIGAILSTTAVGMFEAPLRIVNFLSYGGQAVSFGVAPRMARKSDGGPDVETFQRALRLLVIVQAALIAPLLVWAQPMADLALGSNYSRSDEVLRGLAPFAFMLGIGTLLTLAVNFLGEARKRVPIAIVALALNVGIDLLLIPEIGVVGGAVGTDVAFAFYVVGHAWICSREIRFDTRSAGITVLRCLIAAAAMAGVLALFGSSSLSALAWVGGSLAAVVVYLLSLVALRELSREDLSELRSMLAALRARAAG